MVDRLIGNTTISIEERDYNSGKRKVIKNPTLIHDGKETFRILYNKYIDVVIRADEDGHPSVSMENESGQIQGQTVSIDGKKTNGAVVCSSSRDILITLKQ